MEEKDSGLEFGSRNRYAGIERIGIKAVHILVNIRKNGIEHLKG
jgi:hypothetical protein